MFPDSNGRISDPHCLLLVGVFDVIVLPVGVVDVDGILETVETLFEGGPFG